MPDHISVDDVLQNAWSLLIILQWLAVTEIEVPGVDQSIAPPPGYRTINLCAAATSVTSHVAEQGNLTLCTDANDIGTGDDGLSREQVGVFFVNLDNVLALQRMLLLHGRLLNSRRWCIVWRGGISAPSPEVSVSCTV